jgi:hypothetical protein
MACAAGLFRRGRTLGFRRTPTRGRKSLRAHELTAIGDFRGMRLKND